jgi:hypothetical protein
MIWMSILCVLANLVLFPCSTGRGMYRLTWFVQYFNLSIANVGTIILAGEALKVILLQILKRTTIL